MFFVLVLFCSRFLNVPSEPNINLENGDKLGLPIPLSISSHIERYADGYILYKDDVNIYVTTPSTLENRITGFDGIKDGKIIKYVASVNFWTDEDIKRSYDISLYQQL